MSQSTVTPKGDALVYLVISPETGAQHRLYLNDDIQATGGVHAVERVLEKESYWFVRLGQINGKQGSLGLTFTDSALADLPEPTESAWQIGCLNPAFGGSEISKITFKAAFQAIERMLELWAQKGERVVDAYALKELKIDVPRLVSLVNGLRSLQRIHEVVEITVIKYWYDPLWPGRHLPDDLALAEFSLTVPLQFRWAADEKLISVEIMLTSSC